MSLFKAMNPTPQAGPPGSPLGGGTLQQIMASIFGPMGGSSGSPYGMYGSMLGGRVPQTGAQAATPQPYQGIR